MLCNVMFIFIVIRSCFGSRGCSIIILELKLSAMDCFLASSSLSSPGRAEQAATASSSAGGAEDSGTSGRSVEQPARSAITSAGSAGRPLSSSAAHLSSSDSQPVPDEGREEQPKKRCKHDHEVVSVDDVNIPQILHLQSPGYEQWCEQWNLGSAEQPAADLGAVALMGLFADHEWR